MPLCYLAVRAFDANSEELARVVLRERNLMLLGNTLLLTGATLLVDALIAFPLAWLTTRTTMIGRRFFTVMAIVPLALPTYLMAYPILSIGGNYGSLGAALGLDLPRITGFWGALAALSFCTFPYLFLNLRTAMMSTDRSLEDVARSLGDSPVSVFLRVTLPMLRPAIYSSFLLIGLHVLSDFGAVSLMGFETFSYALYTQYVSAFDRTYAAWLALMLLAITVTMLIIEARLLYRLRFHRAHSGSGRPPRPLRLGRWTVPAYAFLTVVFALTVALPIGTIGYWASVGGAEVDGEKLWTALRGSVQVSVLTAVTATLLTLPIVYMSVRTPTRMLTRVLERTAYMGYAVPALAFALALIFFSLRLAPFLYQSLFLLVYAYTIRYLAEAVGPIRTALYQAKPSLEEASRSLGLSKFHSFLRVTFPLLRHGLIVSGAFVFLSVMKELPLTFLLSPIGYRTLAVDVWSFVDEAMFADAAPYALAILVSSCLFMTVLLVKERRIAL